MSGVHPAAGSHFADNWLTRREAVDHRSRAHGLAALAAGDLRRRVGNRSARVVDLGAGRGSNLRYLAPRLDGPITWRLLDQDSDLLAAAARDTGPYAHGAGDVSTEIVDLGAPLTPMLAKADLVTASALIDLVSHDWIQAFAAACADTGTAVLIALSVDGRIEFADHEAGDTLVSHALARDQARHKGLGHALGGMAPATLINALACCGYAVTAQPSDWYLDAADSTLARALIEGWRDAAVTQQPNQAERITQWAERRARHIAQGRTRLRVGHVDVLGLPNRRSPA